MTHAKQTQFRCFFELITSKKWKHWGLAWHILYLRRIIVNSKENLRDQTDIHPLEKVATTCQYPYTGQGLLFRRKMIFRTFPETGNYRFSVFFRSENDLKFKFRFSTFSDLISVFSDRISVFSDRKMLLVIGNCKISEEKLKILQHFV